MSGWMDGCVVCVCDNSCVGCANFVCFAYFSIQLYPIYHSSKCTVRLYMKFWFGVSEVTPQIARLFFYFFIFFPRGYLVCCDLKGGAHTMLAWPDSATRKCLCVKKI